VQDILKNQARQVGPSSSGGGGGNSFWYVLTFASWMLVPLITVYWYRLKK